MTKNEPLSKGITIQSSSPLYIQKHVQNPNTVGEKDASSLTENVQTPLIHQLDEKQGHDHHTHEQHEHHSHEEHEHSHVHNDTNTTACHHDHHDLHNHGQYSHEQHNHDHHSHDQHNHDHHSHDHHSHDQHNHDHHNHDHHDHHNHDHHPTFTPVYTRPLPSWFQVFSKLIPAQKTIFTWFLIHFSISIWLYCMGMARESLSLIGYGYLMIFDSLGILNTFVSSILRTNPAFGVSNTKRPYGAHRYEIVFALGTTIYLLFATMHNTKESLEHFLLQNHHNEEAHEENHHATFSIGMFLLMGAGISATCLSCVGFRNHENFVKYLRRRPTTVHGFTYNVINRARSNPINSLLSNIYSSSIVACGAIVLCLYMFGIATPFLDKTMALCESVVMFYLGYPTAKALAKVLLQTTPNTVQNGVETRLGEILQDPNILGVDRVHFWQTTYGKCVGTIEIRVTPSSDEQTMLQLVYQKLQGLTSSDIVSEDANASELTVCIVK
ncbi:hypothetical protein K501DRAFT_259808 [Backusella circina FSU 941]|nr:hypothetical protein K501DRAFT_259808 [Backusella circina FSU 941]